MISGAIISLRLITIITAITVSAGSGPAQLPLPIPISAASSGARKRFSTWICPIVRRQPRVQLVSDARNNRSIKPNKKSPRLNDDSFIFVRDPGDHCTLRGLYVYLFFVILDAEGDPGSRVDPYGHDCRVKNI